jgi:hypothetical protein
MNQHPVPAHPPVIGFPAYYLGRPRSAYLDRYHGHAAPRQ